MSQLGKGSSAHPQSLNLIGTLLNINRSFRIGDEENFDAAWARVVSSVNRGVGSKASTSTVVNAMQFLELFSKVYFVIYPQRASLGEEVCREARNRFRGYLERVLADAATRTSALVRSREFATYAGIAVIPDARANAAYLPLFADKWSEGLLLRLNAFINGLVSSASNPDQSPPSSKSNLKEVSALSPAAASARAGPPQKQPQEKERRGGPAGRLNAARESSSSDASSPSARLAML
jgi:hypothetical protein